MADGDDVPPSSSGRGFELLGFGLVILGFLVVGVGFLLNLADSVEIVGAVAVVVGTLLGMRGRARQRRS
jgi:hypothetical protein